MAGVAVGKVPASLVSAITGDTYRTRVVLIAPDERTARLATSPVVLPTERIEIPPVSSRGTEIPHLINSVIVELGSQRRVEELAHERIAALCEYAWPENHQDLRRAADRLRALLEHHGNVSAAARSLVPPLTPASLSEYLVRIGALEGKRR